MVIGNPPEGDTDALSDDAKVMRGGRMTAGRILRRAQADKARLGLFGISAFAASRAEMSIADLVQSAELPHPLIQKSTVARIREAGFRIERSHKWPHCTIDLGEAPDADVAAKLIAAFDLPEPTPRTGGQR